MPSFDKSQIKAGVYMIGGPGPGVLVTRDLNDSFAEAETRMAAARKKLDELVAAVRARRR